MIFDRSRPAELLYRLLFAASLLALAAITLQDRGSSVMYATPWRLAYWTAVLLPAVLLLLRLRPGAAPLRLPTGPWLSWVAATGLVLLAAAVASPFRTVCLQWTALPLAGLAVFLLVHDWLQAAPDRPVRLADYLAVAGGVLVLVSNIYWVADLGRLAGREHSSAELFEMRNPHPLGHANYTAGLCLLVLPWLLLAAGRHRGIPRGLAAAASGLALLALFMSGSRGGLLGLAGLGLAWLATTRPDWRRFAWSAGAIAVAAGGIAVANPRIRALLTPADPGAAPNASDVQRHAMLVAGRRMGADRPWLGWGLHTTPSVYPRFRAALQGGPEDVLQLHSTPVELWAGLGGPGLLLLGGFVVLAAGAWARAPVAAAALAGYAVFALTDYQLDVPVFVLALAVLAAQLAAPGGAAAAPGLRLGLAGATLAALALVVGLGGPDPVPPLNVAALRLAQDPAQRPQAVALLQESLALEPDQEIAHFNLGWLQLVPDPADAARHFRAAARLVPDKGGVYFGLGLALLNQAQTDAAARAFALECLNDPRFLASPWWNEPAIAAEREAARTAFAALAQQTRSALPAGTWSALQAERMLSLAARLGTPSPGPVTGYRRERTGYPVLMRDLDLPPPVDLFDVREDARFPASVAFPLPPKGWLPAPLLLKLLDEIPGSGH